MTIQIAAPSGTLSPARVGGQRLADVRLHGGADRLALPFEHPARRPDRHCGPDGCVESAPDRDIELEVVRLERDVGEARFAQDPPHPHLAGEGEGPRRLGIRLGQGRGVLARFAQRQDEERILPCLPPAGEGEPPAGFKAAPQVGEGSGGVGEEHDAEPGRHEVGRFGLESVDGGVGPFEPDRQAFPRSRARASIGSEMSSPSTSPPGLTRAAKSIVVAPQPQPTSITRSPGFGRAAAISRSETGLST